MKRAAEFLLIVAFELADDVRTREPPWEFLRHCRNAAAHGGAFAFRGPEPRRPAVWRGLELTQGMSGERLFHHSDDQPGLLGLGDPVRLLIDLDDLASSSPETSPERPRSDSN
jgi:hypothetical protein